MRAPFGEGAAEFMRQQLAEWIDWSLNKSVSALQRPSGQPAALATVPPVGAAECACFQLELWLTAAGAWMLKPCAFSLLCCSPGCADPCPPPCSSCPAPSP